MQRWDFSPFDHRANSLLLKMLMESWFKTFFLHFYFCCCCCFLKRCNRQDLGFDFLVLHKERFWSSHSKPLPVGPALPSCHHLSVVSPGGVGRWVGGEDLEEGRVFVSYVESWLTTLPPFMVGVPELFLERPCFSPISCSDGSLYMHTANRRDTR